MLEKLISFDQIVTEDGAIQVRQITRIMEDGKELSKAYHRHVVEPGDDFGEQDEQTKKIAQVIHTEAVVAKYKEKKEKAVAWKWKKDN